MKITRTVHEQNHDLIPRQTIKIEIEPGDDPHGFINGLVIRGRLESLLKGYGDSTQFASPDLTAGDFWELLTSFAYAAGTAERIHDLLLVLARDQRGLSWREIENATEIPQATIRRRVKAARERMAERGRWINAAGIQIEDSDRAKMHASILDLHDDRATVICRYCHETLRATAVGRDPLKDHALECTRDPASPFCLHSIEIEYGEGDQIQTLYAELDYDKYTRVVAAQSHETPENAYVAVYAKLDPWSELAPRTLRGDLIKRVEPIMEPHYG